MTPRQSIAAECDRRGSKAVVDGCIDLIEGREADDELIMALSGGSATTVFTGREGGRTGYWVRVWATRGLLHNWHAEATNAIIVATRDEAWRVREMAAKVVARHVVGDAFVAVEKLRTDPVPRVRAAAERALANLTAVGA